MAEQQANSMRRRYISVIAERAAPNSAGLGVPRNRSTRSRHRSREDGAVVQFEHSSRINGLR